ncbi:hypothetical protein B0H13DRAFT_1874176 [Mycena leptocephala]|nr:hypothetical protein B0H13DRAFT_1874176 [Mycena leptocephala]
MGDTPKALLFKTTRKRRSKAQKQHTAALTTSTASIASADDGKENDTGEELQTAKRRGDNYQKELYGTRKKLKRSHTANANQAAVLAETQLENGRLHAQVNHLEDEIMGLEKESSSLRADTES